MRFREHRGGLTESMETLVVLQDRTALVAHIRELVSPYMILSDWDASIDVKPYNGGMPDGWDQTYIVLVKDHGVIGFTDQAA